MEEIREISIEEENYPLSLRKLEEPPLKLYYRGKPPGKEKFFAIVGTRSYSPYGKEVALKIGRELAAAGLTIVSGLAPGVDTFAHQGTLEAKGRTIAVLGTGVDEKSIYPKTNIALSRKIIKEGGCLLSEYPPGTHGSKTTFPRRNRIISGLSIGVLVVEAKMKSGSLITANWAKKQGKKLFAIPGNIYSPTSKGCHYLIKEGAKLVEGAEDILADLGLSYRKKGGEEPKGENREEEIILNVLKRKALHIDGIIRKTSLPPALVLSTLAILEIKGKVRNLGGNRYTIF